MAYVLQKTPYMFPIVGGRKVEHPPANIEALDVALTPEHMKQIESVVRLGLGFPTNFIGDGTDYGFAYKSVGALDAWPVSRAIRPSQ
ncbi:hypothetical protein C8Q77DRAFT_1158321 [Trametes polyzona]|nr:hypothetical protein C8Q77DRAFT_1158321 [Trametes polyzona]